MDGYDWMVRTQQEHHKKCGCVIKMRGHGYLVCKKHDVNKRRFHTE